MAKKTFIYAVYEAVQHEMRQRKDMTWLFELTPCLLYTSDAADE